MRASAAPVSVEEDDLVLRMRDIEADLLDEYRQDHDHAWIVGFSGGKDSTLVAHLVFSMLLALPRSQRKRRVHIVANDTLVESPLSYRILRAFRGR